MITRESDEQQEQRRDVAEQHVLEHVRREEVVLAEAVDRGDERGQQGEHGAGEGERVQPRRPRPPASRRALRKRRT